MPFPSFFLFFFYLVQIKIFFTILFCDSQIHYAFIILVLLQKSYGLPLPDVDIAAAPGLE